MKELSEEQQKELTSLYQHMHERRNMVRKQAEYVDELEAHLHESKILLRQLQDDYNDAVFEYQKAIIAIGIDLIGGKR